MNEELSNLVEMGPRAVTDTNDSTQSSHVDFRADIEGALIDDFRDADFSIADLLNLRTMMQFLAEMKDRGPIRMIFETHPNEDSPLPSPHIVCSVVLRPSSAENDTATNKS